MIKNLKFDWHKTGQNCDANILEANVLGHHAKVIRSYENKLWNVIVDHRGKTGFESEELAILEAESQIELKIHSRFEKANQDLKLFEEHNLQFL